MLSQEQAAESRKAALDNLFGLTQKIAEGIAQLTELHMRVARATLTDTLDQTLKGLSVREPHEWLALQGTLSGPTVENAQAYSRQLIEIVSATQAECARFARTQYEAYGRGVQTLMRDVARNAPAGSEAAVAALDSAITATNALVETLQRTGEQAAEVTKSNFDLAASAATKSAQRAAASHAHAVKR